MAEGRQNGENSNPPPFSKSTTASEIQNMFGKVRCFECPADELPHHALSVFLFEGITETHCLYECVKKARPTSFLHIYHEIQVLLQD
ncbi:hypothetical protein Hanom_Chr16g01521411 [Helianthus anomalus]